MKKRIPVINFSLFEFTRRACLGGGISPKRILLLFAYYFQMIPMLPFAFLQYLFFGKRIRNTKITSAPIFILGHYRTGTTLLQKLLTSDKRFGFLSYYDALFANSNLLFTNNAIGVFQRLINTFKIKNPFFHNTILNLKEPDEEDDYLMNLASPYSAYWGMIFPKKWRDWLNCSPQLSDEKYREAWCREYLKTLRYLTFKNHGKQLILKSPPNTERISVLREMFPDSKFIFIRRNPYHLYYSIRNMWKQTILRYYSLQSITDAQLDEIIFGHFEHLMAQYQKQKKQIPEGNLIEISYGDLKSDPFQVVKRIYSELSLPDFRENFGNLRKQLEFEKNYQSFHYQYDDETLEKIKQQWGKFIEIWDYHAPTTDQPNARTK